MILGHKKEPKIPLAFIYYGYTYNYKEINTSFYLLKKTFSVIIKQLEKGG